MSVVNEARNDTYKRLAKLAGSVGLEESQVLELLEISDKPGEGGALNIGNKVTDDIKLMVKVRPPLEFGANEWLMAWPIGEPTDRCSCDTNGFVQCE